MTAFADRKPIICACGNHAFVAITRGLTTMVSPEDAHLLTAKWQAEPRRGRHLAVGPMMTDQGLKQRNLGRVVLGLPSHLVPDHINSDPLDNRRSNLRPATVAQNGRNRRPMKRTLPKGVHKDGGVFRARIRVDGKLLSLGRFGTAAEAHEAYATAALEHFGEFARPS